MADPKQDRREKLQKQLEKSKARSISALQRLDESSVRLMKMEQQYGLRATLDEASDRYAPPDTFIGGIWGWRLFSIGRDWDHNIRHPQILTSLTADRTHDFGPEPVEATCGIYERNKDKLYNSIGVKPGELGRYRTPMHPYGIPGPLCQCGFYAFDSLENLIAQGRPGYFDCLALVRGWGKVIVCTYGYRMQYMQIMHVFLSDTEVRRTPWGTDSRKRDLRVSSGFSKDQLHTFTPIETKNGLFPAGAYAKFRAQFKEWLNIGETPVQVPRAEIPDDVYEQYSGKQVKD